MAQAPVTEKAAAASATVTLPRRTIMNKVRLSDPGYPRQDDAVLYDNEVSLLNTSIKEIRRTLDPLTAIRALTRFNGIFSTAVAAYTEVAMSGFKVTGYLAGTHEFDVMATNAAIATLVSADTLYDYTEGYADKPSTDGLLSTLLKESFSMGACSQELVLNRFRLPEKICPVPVTSLRWASTKEGTIWPKQVTNNAMPGLRSNNVTKDGFIDLDIPTFFYAAVQQPANTVFARSPLEPALQMLFIFMEFIEDMMQALRRAGHNRVVVSIVQEAVKAMATPDTQNDQKKLMAFMEDVRSQVESTIKNMNPEDALVTYDSAKVDALQTKGEKADYASLLNTLGTLMASSLKSMPSVLGLSQGSQNLATTEALVFLKMVRAIQVPVETVMSRTLTLATRLITGRDSYVKFRFEPINIRPADELSAHKSVLFQNALQKLSLGLYTDDYFAHVVGTGPRPANAPILSGTMFMNQQATQPKDMNLNDNGQARNLNEGTAQGSPTSQGGGAPA